MITLNTIAFEWCPPSTGRMAILSMDVETQIDLMARDRVLGHEPIMLISERTNDALECVFFTHIDESRRNSYTSTAWDYNNGVWYKTKKVMPQTFMVRFKQV